jgi:hypothetical protein
MYNRELMGNVESEASSGRIVFFLTGRSVFDGQEVGVGGIGETRRGADAVATGRAGSGVVSAIRDFGADALSLAG